MKRLVIESWIMLLYFGFVMQFCDFKRLHKTVRGKRVRTTINRDVTSAELCHAVDLACVFYCKRVLCLQRSAATAILLRRNGWKAEMVLGAQLLPFTSHAWVEIEGRVVNDKPYVTEIFKVLERC